MNKNIFSHIIFLCLLVSTLISCKEKRPANIIPETQMENILYDYHLAKSLGDDLTFNENYKRGLYINAVFNKYDISQAEFDSSMNWYTRHADVLSKIYDNISIRFKSKQTVINQLIAIRDKKPMTSAAGDSIDVWAWKRILRLSNNNFNNSYKFILPSDSNFKNRDEIVWEANFHFTNSNEKDSINLPLMAMQIVYNNDSIISDYINIAENGLNQIRLASDTLGDIKEIKGFLYIPSHKQDIDLIINDISLYRYHNNDTTSLNIDSLANILSPDSLETLINAIPSKEKDNVVEEVSNELKNASTTNNLREQSKKISAPTTKFVREQPAEINLKKEDASVARPVKRDVLKEVERKEIVID